MPEHDVAPLGEIHRIANWEYANAAARTGATGILPSDVGKWAKQLDDGSYWELTDDAPLTWEQRTGLVDDSVSNAKLANMAQSTIKGRAAGAGTGDPTDLSATQVAVILAEDIQDIVGAMFQDGDINFNYDDGGNVETNVLQNQFKTAVLVFEFGDGKNATSLEADQTARIPYVPAGTIVRARIEGDPSGSAVVDIRKSTADPPSYSSICASAKPTLSSDVFVDDTTLTGWTTSLSAGNALLAVLESVATCKQVTVILEVRKS